MVEILWTVLALCGFAIIVYGVFLFFALPAAGVFVAMTGLLIVNVSLRRTVLLNERLNALRKRNPKGKRFRDPDQLGRQADTIGEKIPIVKSYKIFAFFLFVTNLFIVSAIIPNFSGSFGSEVGSLVSGGLRIVVTLFYTGLILALFRSAKSLAVVVLVTWAVIILRAVR
jgi:hypothetical protein